MIYSSAESTPFLSTIGLNERTFQAHLNGSKMRAQSRTLLAELFVSQKEIEVFFFFCSYLNEESQHSSDTQRGRWHARDEEHFSLRDEANARTQWLQKIPLCGRSAALAATHRED